MGDSDISTALAKRNASNALMAPPPKPKRVRRPQKVLDEDTYTTALEYIIARDFYPGLLETKTLGDYLDALESGDEVYIAEKERLARTVMNTPRAAMGTPRRGPGEMTPLDISAKTPRTVSGGDTLATGATPGRRSTSGSESRALLDHAGNNIDLHLNLSDFQARYTSEDNESFYKIVDRQNLKKAAQRAWYWTGNKLPSKRQIAQAAVHEQRRIAGGSDSQALVKAAQPSENRDERPANIDPISQHSNQGPKNSLMFMADGVTDTHPGLVTAAEKRQQRSNAPPKAVNYANVRLAQASADKNGEINDAASTIPPSPSLSAIDAAIRGVPVPRRASTLAPSSIAPEEDEEEQHHGQGAFAYVDVNPTPSELAAFVNGPPKPTASGPPPQKSLLEEMVEANAGATGASNFSISAPSRREEVRDRLVEKQLASRRTPMNHLRSSDRLNALRGETPRFLSSPRPGGATPSKGNPRAELTPAAQRLYDTLGRTPGSGSSRASANGKSAFDETGKAAWTPTPLRVKKTGK